MRRSFLQIIVVAAIYGGSIGSLAQNSAMPLPSSRANLPASNGDETMDAFIRNFYVYDGTGAGHYSSKPASSVTAPSVAPAGPPAAPNGCNGGVVDVSATAPASFWNQAEEIETTEDAADRNPLYTPVVISLLDGFRKINTDSWTKVTCYNDDVMWASLAFIRGYELTGDSRYLSLAQSNFDAAYARGYDPAIMAMHWSVYVPSLNAITNETASLAAGLLARYMPSDSGYRDKSATLLDYVLANYYQPDGAVIGSAGQGPTTYNDGVFIEAAFLNSHEGEASNTAAYLSTVAGKVQPGSGSFHILNNYAGDQNNLGFNSIALRWIHRYAMDSGKLPDYEGWLRANAVASHNVRNEGGNSWQDWSAVTPPNSLLLSWDCVSGVTAAQVAESPWGDR